MKSQTKIGRFFGAGPVKKTHAGKQPGLQATCGVNLAIDKLVGVQPEHSRSWFGTSGRIGQSYSGRSGARQPTRCNSGFLEGNPYFHSHPGWSFPTFLHQQAKGGTKTFKDRFAFLSGNGNQPQRTEPILRGAFVKPQRLRAFASGTAWTWPTDAPEPRLRGCCPGSPKVELLGFHLLQPPGENKIK